MSTAHDGSAVIVKLRHYELFKRQKRKHIQAVSIMVEGLVGLITVFCSAKHKIKGDGFTEFFESLGCRLEIHNW